MSTARTRWGRAKAFARFVEFRAFAELRHGERLEELANHAKGAGSATKKTVRYVDGLAISQDIAAVAARDAHDLFIGAMAAGNGHFTGDIAAFRLYDRALSSSEVAALSKRYAYDYGFLLLPRVKFGASDVAVNGFRATNVNVAAGATFRLPYSETDPFVLKGVSLTGEGTFLGSYRLGEGSTFSSATAANIEDLRLSTGSTLVFRRSDTLPLTAGEGLRLSGAITVDVSDFASEQRQPGYRYLMSIDSAKVAEGTSFVLKGLDPLFSKVVYDRSRGLLYVRTQNGSLLLVR